MNVKMDQSWKRRLESEFTQGYFQTLTEFVKKEYGHDQVFPHPSHIFRAFDACPFDDVKVVILGQDPYHGMNQAMGLSFSVNEGIAFPPSLLNIFKELNHDVGKPMPTSGDLSHWAVQGVLLLNATLTVRAGLAGSHQGRGWEQFTDKAIEVLSEQRDDIVFMLWGSYAQAKGKFIDRSKHLILESPHPSPLSAHRGFFGCGHFSKANVYLAMHGKEPIEW